MAWTDHQLEDPTFNIRVLQRPFHAQSGEGFVGTRASVEGGKPTQHTRAITLDQLPCSSKGLFTQVFHDPPPGYFYTSTM